jgi:quinol monooxygenase YgiN
MAEVRVIARAVAREGKSEELKALFHGLLKPTRAEAGCKFYEVVESNQPGLFYFNELWESHAHLDAHVASSHFIEIFGKSKALVTGPLEVNLLKSIG